MSVVTDEKRAAPSFTAAPDMRAHILTYLNGRSLLYCACVCREVEHLVDNRKLWELAALKEYSHLVDTLDHASYGDEWRALFVDRNRRNRSISTPLSIRNVATAFTRTDPIRLNEYEFQVATIPPGVGGYMGVSFGLSCAKPPVVGEPAAWTCWVSAEFFVAQGADHNTFRSLGRLSLKYDSVTYHELLLASIIPPEVLDPAEGYVHDGAVNLKMVLKKRTSE